MFYNLNNLVKLTIKTNKKGFIIKNNINNLKLLKAFLKINIIKFIKIEKKNIIVYINYLNNKPVFKSITNLFKSSNKKYISLKCLKEISQKHNWILLLSTNKGILNNYEAINLNVGGLLLTKISN